MRWVGLCWMVYPGLMLVLTVVLGLVLVLAVCCIEYLDGYMGILHYMS